jgi:hypothetical protein
VQEPEIHNQVLAAMSESLRALTTSMVGLTESAKEDRRMLHDIHERIVKIESNRLEGEVLRLQNCVDKLDEKVDKLTLDSATDRASRDTAIGMVGWVSKNAPWLAAIALAGAAAFGYQEVSSK